MRTVNMNITITEGQNCILLFIIILYCIVYSGEGILTCGGIYGMSLGHHAIVTALHLIGSGDGIVCTNGIGHKSSHT